MACTQVDSLSTEGILNLSVEDDEENIASLLAAPTESGYHTYPHSRWEKTRFIAFFSSVIIERPNTSSSSQGLLLRIENTSATTHIYPQTHLLVCQVQSSKK